MPAAAAIAVAVVAAGTSGYQSYQASQDKSQAIDEKGRQEKLAEKAQTDALAQQQKEKEQVATANANADKLDAANALRLMQQRMRNNSTPRYNKGGTLLTGPSGVGTAPISTGPRTLLGQ